MIKVVNKHTHIATKCDVYCGRGGAFGNEWDWRSPSKATKRCGSREEAISNFKCDFLNRVESKDESLLAPLRAAYRLAARGDLNLVCFCAPDLDCHATVIKEWLEGQIRDAYKKH